MRPFHVEGFRRLPGAGRVRGGFGAKVAATADVGPVLVEDREARRIPLVELLIEPGQVAELNDADVLSDIAGSS